ncbi:glycosyltransferase [Pontibacter harenae]|uniref:glycosyltransferase n=1 Tax=Pontibacter harenae TaxID=2894083 RepID=UPI001E49DAFE|nr:glycosyltransferase [Pontibacter harenae]MCC9167611.1 glycosyltransferase [Pontibacter harenae]
MSEKRILIASLLKPINDTRMYEKMGLSLSKLPHTHIHVAGFDAPAPTSAPANIFFHPVFNFKRLGFGRAQAQVTFYRLLKQLKPHLIIVGTHELLLTSYLYARSSKCKLVYDIQENYTLNLKEQNNYKPLAKRVLARGVGSIEKFVVPSVDHFLVAEKSYLQELTFLGNKYTLLENKYKAATNYTPPSTPVAVNPAAIKLLYSGTIAEIYGIFEAVEFASALHKVHAGITLTIIGYCARSSTLQHLKQLIQDKNYITLIGGDKLVPHQQILEQIQHSDVGLLPYQPNPSTFRCIPTKLYEYMAHALPLVVQQNPLWHNMVKRYQAGVSINFRQADAKEMLNQLEQQVFYKAGISNDLYWQSEEDKLLPIVASLL